jgi:hypothetical protein
MQCQQAENLKNCPCTYPSCPRKGFCCQCIKHHRKRRELPACYFSAEIEKTYDRRISIFLREQQKNEN